MTGVSPTHAEAPTTHRPLPGWQWALRRAALGLAIMLGVTFGAAWLLYAGIEPEPAQVSDLAEPAMSEPRAARPAE